jgi:hypothetical protein
LKSRALFIPEKSGNNLDLHQGRIFPGALIFRQMKAKLARRTPQQFARLAKRAVENARQPTRNPKTIMKTTSAQLSTIIALGCSAVLYFTAGCSQAPSAPPKEVTVQADDKMRYDFTAFDASPG